MHAELIFQLLLKHLGSQYYFSLVYIYFDLNLNFWNVLFTLGTGRGVFLDKDKKYPRNKYWGGLGFIPIILCTDNYFINEYNYKKLNGN